MHSRYGRYGMGVFEMRTKQLLPMVPVERELSHIPPNRIRKIIDSKVPNGRGYVGSQEGNECNDPGGDCHPGRSVWSITHFNLLLKALVSYPEGTWIQNRFPVIMGQPPPRKQGLNCKGIDRWFIHPFVWPAISWGSGVLRMKARLILITTF